MEENKHSVVDQDKEELSIHFSSDEEDVKCDPCFYQNLSTKATSYCVKCEENLCDKCIRRHKERKATKDHNPISIQEYRTIINDFVCDPCKDEDRHVAAESICNNCDEQLCQSCSASHRKRKATKEHVLFPISGKIEKELELSKILCTVCEADSKFMKAESFCKSCEEYLCINCTKHHSKRKATKNHGFINVKEMDNLSNLSQLTCDQCDEEGKIMSALQFCEECLEYLCSDCSKKHCIRRATKVHILEDFNIEVLEQTLCSKCKNDEIKQLSALYCNHCEELLCQKCARKHKVNKKTGSHEMMSSLKFLEKKECIVKCVPCNLQNVETEAIFFCKECDETFCETCDKHHRARKITKDHGIVKLEEMTKDTTKLCDPCSLQEKQNTSESFCEVCDEFLCKGCAQEHSVQKATKDHNLESAISFKNKLRDVKKSNCDVCKSQKIDAVAFKFCTGCGENLCESCTRIHKTQKATKQHVVIGIRQSSPSLDDTQGGQKLWCKPCTLQNQAIEAETHCMNCNEDLCSKCTSVHKRIPGAASNEIIDIKTWISNFPHRDKCDQCSLENSDKIAITFCENCDQNLCEFCTKVHKNFKITRNHSLVSIGSKTPEKTADKFKGKGDLDTKSMKLKEFELLPMSPPIEKNVTANSISLSWKEPPETEHKIKFFDIQYRTAIIPNQWKSETTNVNTISYTVKDLASGTPYEFQIRAVYDYPNEICGPFSAISAHITTRQSTLSKPTLVEAIGDKVIIDWKIDDEIKSSISHYEIRYRKTGESRWQVTSTNDSYEIGAIGGLQGNTTYEFKVRPIFDDGEGPYGPVSDHITTKSPYPGTPKKHYVGTDNITIQWKRPEGGTLSIKNYDIRFRTVGEDTWNLKRTIDSDEISTITELKGSTSYEFQVRAVYEDFEGQYGPISYHITTETTLARKLKSMANKIISKLDESEPERYKVPISLDQNSINSNAKFRRCIFGNRKGMGIQEKTIMLVGATGSGKSTLIDGMINYILDVAWDDEFRYNLIDLMQDEEGRSGNQAVSQTEWITNYTINYTKGSQIYYNLNIIDTPGFGDTRGIQRDRKIVEQMRELFSIKGNRDVATIDAVCFVTQAPLTRLSPTQKYIFESILSIFGRDIKENIFILITFADCNKPPVLDALTKADIPYVDKFVFNNSALFAAKQVDFAPMFWKMGKESFKKFFTHLQGMKTKSLQMTADVLNERRNLETTVQDLRPQIIDGLNTLEVLRKTRNILKQHRVDIEANKNFCYEVQETRQRQINLDAGVYVTNCLTCNRTCHFPCHIARDDQKSGCDSMKDGNCTVCPNKCRWDVHKNNAYRIETYTETIKRTYDELKKKYESATIKAQTSRQLLQSMKNELDKLRKKVGKMVEEVRRSLIRLSEIALKPNPLSNSQYIDILIETEKQEGKEGFQARIKMLSNLREDAKLLEKVPEGTFQPWGNVDMSDLEDDDDDNGEENAAKTKSEKKKKRKFEQLSEFLFGQKSD